MNYLSHNPRNATQKATLIPISVEQTNANIASERLTTRRDATLRAAANFGRSLA